MSDQPNLDADPESIGPVENEVFADSQDTPGGSRELIKLALPLVLSQSFMTLQVFVDTVLLSWHDPLEMAASLPAVMWYWLGFGLLQVTAGYTSTFVAQYTGAKRPHRVGPATWQGIHFALVAGSLFLLVMPAAPYLISLGQHSEQLQRHEIVYLQCLAWAALPMLLVSSINGFFSGRGQTWTVLGIDTVGTVVNIALSVPLVFGLWGFPELGIAGAGIATVIGSWSAALFALSLFLRPKFREEFQTLSGWWPDRALFGRLMWYGGPAGVQIFLDVLVFHMFAQLVGRLGEAEMGATSLAIRLNMIAFLPVMGLGMAVSILVGQRLGSDRPDLAEKSTYTGLRWATGYLWTLAAVYILLPQSLIAIFHDANTETGQFEAIAAMVPTLLMFVAAYSLADGVNLTFAFALRGAGDTKFVTAVTFILAWPVMVLPTWYVVKNGYSLYWAWGFATSFILAMAVCFWLRFRYGKWKSMRVIEPVGIDIEPEEAAGLTAELGAARPELQPSVDGGAGLGLSPERNSQ